MYPYWIDVEEHFNAGAGITAQSETDALAIFKVAFGDRLHAKRVRRIHNMSEIDQKHILPNMGNVLRRGVWYPKGLEHLSI